MTVLHVAGSRPRPCTCECSCQPTELELRILAHAASGLTNRQVAVEFGIHERTVENALRAIRERLGARDRVHLITVAFRDRLLGFDRDGRVVVAEREKAAA